jgi:SAM-dependent methyltransferase/uncharacterized protein YbaR (Trm112 family)
MNAKGVSASQALSPKLLEYICCPACRGDLRFSPACPDAREGTGTLTCTGCATRFDVLHGVPILISGASAAEMFTARNFGQQWELFDKLGGLGKEFEENQFAEYLAPLDTAQLKDKAILEAGCGYGRNLLAALRHGASVAIGFDVGPAAFIAKRKGADAVIGDILNPPFRKPFDVVFSFGVLQHVSDPERGFKKLYEHVNTGGIFCHSVYSAENNRFLSQYLTPVRERLFRHFPPLLNWIIASVLGTISYVVFRIVYGPFFCSRRASAWASAHLFYYDYLALTLRKLGLKQWVAQIFDHLNAPLATYFPKEQLIGWTEEVGLDSPYFYFRNKNAWNFGGYKR